ncbi:MAG TPA: hypothetical protein VGG33_14030 [Polyangia bacterium]
MRNLLSGFSLVAVLATQMSGTGFAEDDNAPDGKAYPPSFCRPVAGGGTHTVTGGAYVNSSGGSQNVICPVVKDSWQASSGLNFTALAVNNVNGGSIACSICSRTMGGDSVACKSSSTTTTGVQTLLFWDGSYLGSTASQGNISITCTLGNGDMITGYSVQEKL